MPSPSPRRLTLAGSVLAAAALSVARAPAQEAPPPIAFQEISTLSGGPVDIPVVGSATEKNTGAFADLDGDGWDDLVILTGPGEPTLLLLNRPDGNGGRTFVRGETGTGLDTGAPMANDGASITIGDVDSDGDEDLYIGCGFNLSTPSGENILLLNDGTGHFTDVTAAVGLSDGDNTTAACCLFDMDLDGDLDLLSANTDFWQLDKYGDGVTHLFRNTLVETGVLGFVEETAQRGIVEEGRAIWIATAVDFDDDGDQDVFIPHDINGLTQLFQNDGTGHFTEITETVGGGIGDDANPSNFGDDSFAAMGLAAGDYENDGDLDFYITNIGTNPLYTNNGDGTLRALTVSTGSQGGRVTWGCNFADYDIDGFVDLNVAAGDVYGIDRPTVQAFLYHNQRDGTFVDVWQGSGLRKDVPLHREGGTAVSDFDLDGLTDLFIARSHVEGASPYLYHNVTERRGRHWVAVKLRGNGADTNTSAIGARLRILPRDASGALLSDIVQIREILGADSRGAVSSRVQTFGLGTEAATVDIEVIWPTAGPREDRIRYYGRHDVDQLVEVAQSAEPWRLEPDAETSVRGGGVTQVALRGLGAADPRAVCSVLSGADWARVEGFVGGEWTLRLKPPPVQTDVVRVVRIASVIPGRPTGDSFQDLRVTAIPAPMVQRVTRPGGGTVLRLQGVNFPRDGARVLVDGVESPKVKSQRKGREADGDATRLVVRVPKALRKGFRKAPHSVVVVDAAAGTLSDGFEFQR